MLTFYTIFVSHNEAHRYITYFSKYLASLIYFPTNWILITMWLSMDAVLFMSVSIIFDYHVSLNLPNILHNFCVSQWGSSILLHTFQSISHHWFISLRIGFSLPCGCPWKQYCFVTGHYFDYHVSLNLANILHNFCVSQWSSSILLHTFQSISHHWFISLRIGFSLPCGCPWKQYCFVTGHYFDYHVSLNLANILHNFCVSQWGSSTVLHTFQGISHHWLISLQIGVTLPCGCPWMQILFRQCPLFSIIMCP